MFTSFDDDNDSDFEMDVGTGKLTLYARMDSSFCSDTINLGWSIVYNEGLQVIIIKTNISDDHFCLNSKQYIA